MRPALRWCGVLLLVGTWSGAQRPPAAVFRAEAEGWALQVPAGWKYQQVEGGRVVFGSDTEAGMIIIVFHPGGTFDEVQQSAREGFVDSGLQLRPSSAPLTLQVPGARALAVDLQTTAQDGTALQVRAAGVVGAQGGVVLLGFTTPAKFATLRTRVDQAAKSVTFFTPKAAPGAALLRGALCHFSGGSIASWTRRYTFDGQGHVSAGSEMAAGGALGQGGRWGAASGNQYDAARVGTYAVQGNTVSVRLGGESFTCRVAFRQNDGRITELQCGDRLYGAALCE